jgi:hypothetical protein
MTVAQAYMNISKGHYDGYREDHIVVSAPDLIFRVDEHTAAEDMFSIGNRMSTDLDGASWPSDVRSVSVGDVIGVGHQSKRVFFAVEPVGFKPVPEPTRAPRLKPVPRPLVLSRWE